MSGIEEPVARWEIWSVATMLIASHGDGADKKAEDEIAKAADEEDLGALTVWRAVRMKLDEIRAERGRTP